MIEGLKVIVELLRVLAWPTIVVAAFLVFRQPIESIVDDLPVKFSAATKVGVGALTLEIQQQAKAAGSPQLAMRLGKLSPESIKLLIAMGESRMMMIGTTGSANPDGQNAFFMPDEATLRAIRELAKNGLIDYAEDLDTFLAWIGSPLFRFETSRWQSDDRRFYATRPLSPTELARVKNQSYILNALGKKAWQTVLDAVLEQLRAPTPSTARQKSLGETTGKNQ